jgi:hypothetical protein
MTEGLRMTGKGQGSPSLFIILRRPSLFVILREHGDRRISLRINSATKNLL